MRNDQADDRALLTALHEALDTPRADPSPVERAAFRELVTETYAAGPRWQRAGWSSMLRRPVPAIALAVILLLAGVTTATVKRVPATDPIRSVAHSIGLPIESAELVETRRAMGQLRDELQAGDNEGLAAAADELRDHLTELDSHDRAVVDADATHLLDQADDALHHTEEEGSEPDDHDTDVGPTATTTTAPTATAPTSDAPAEHPEDVTPDHPDSTVGPSPTPTTMGDGHDDGVDSDGSHTGGD